jgi:hypothetical protein
LSAGWIKLWRKVEENPALEEHDALGMFCRLLMRAMRDGDAVFCKKTGRMINLQRGQLWVSLRDLATRKCHYQQVRTIFSRLEQAGIISTEPVAGVTVVTIRNYNEYQSNDHGQEAEPTQVPTQVPTQEQKSPACASNAGHNPTTTCEATVIPLSGRVDNAAHNAVPTQGSTTGQPEINAQKEEDKEGKNRDSVTPLQFPPRGADLLGDPVKEKGKRRKSQKTRIPDDFALTDDLRAYAVEQTPGVDADADFERFVLHHRGKGSEMADWPAAFKYWCRSTFSKPLLRDRKTRVVGRSTGVRFDDPNYDPYS